MEKFTLTFTEDELSTLYGALVHGRQAYAKQRDASAPNSSSFRCYAAFEAATDALVTRVAEHLYVDDGGGQSRGGREDFHSDG